MKILSLSKEDIVPLIEMKEALDQAEEAYRLQRLAQKKIMQSQFSPLVVYEVRTRSGPSGFFDFRSGYIQNIPILISTLGFGYPKIRKYMDCPMYSLTLYCQTWKVALLSQLWKQIT